MTSEVLTLVEFSFASVSEDVVVSVSEVVVVVDTSDIVVLIQKKFESIDTIREDSKMKRNLQRSNHQSRIQAYV